MKKAMIVFMLGIFMLSLVVASTATVTVVDSIGSFSGALLKIKNPTSEFFGSDKINPSGYLSNVGIVKFEVESDIPEVDMQIRMTKDGEFIREILRENVSINGSEIIIDLREKPKVDVEVPEIIEEIENITVEETNVSEEFEVENNETSTGLTGKVTSKIKSTVGENGVYYYGGAGFLIVLLALFLVVKMAYRSGAKNELKLFSKGALDKRIDELDI